MPASVHKPLSKQELHYLAMNLTGEKLKELNYEFIAINSKLGVLPQFVCMAPDKQYYFVMVKNVIFPNDPNVYDHKLMKRFIKHATENNAKVIYAGVGLYNANNLEDTVYKNQPYKVDQAPLQYLS